MLKSKPSIRTDYHKLISSSESFFPEERLIRYPRIAFIFIVGFALGIIYTKSSSSSFRSEALAFFSVKENSVQKALASQNDTTSESSKV